MISSLPAWPRLLRRLQLEAHAGCADRELLEQFSEHGKESAFEALLDRHGPMVLSLCYRSLGDVHQAEDVFQATFLVLAQRSRNIRNRDNVASWLYGVALRLVRKARNCESTRRHHEAVAVELRAESTDPIREEMLRRLDEELERLPDRYQAPLLLCYLQGHTQDEAAARLGWSRSTLRRRLEEGRKRLRDRMREPLEGPGAVTPLAATLREATLAVAFANSKEAVPPEVLALALAGGVSTATASKIVALMMLGALVAIAVALGSSGEAPRKASPVLASLASTAELPLPRGAVARLGTLAFRHGPTFPSRGWFLTFTRDGKHLVSAGGGWIRRWNATTGELLRTVGDGGSATQDVQFCLATADGRFARINSSAGWMAKEYDLATGRERTSCRIEFPRGTASPHAMPSILSPDGQFLAENGEAGVSIFDAATGAFLRFYKTRGKMHRTGLAFHPDGKSVLVGDMGHKFALYDLNSGGRLASFETHAPGSSVYLVAISPDGHWMASVGMEESRGRNFHNPDPFVRLWNLRRGTVVRKLDLLDLGRPESILFTPDGRTLLASGRREGLGENNSVRAWEVSTGKVRSKMPTDPSMGRMLAMRPDGQVLATMNESGVIRLWDMMAGKELTPRTSSATGLGAVTFLPEGEKLLTVGEDLSLFEWNATTGGLVRTNRNQRTGSRVRFSAKGKYFTAHDSIQKNERTQFRSYVWRTRDGKLLFDRTGWLPVVAPDESRVAYLDERYRIQVVEIGTSKVLHTLSPPQGDNSSQFRHPVPLAFTAGGQNLILMGDDLSVWDLASSKRVTSWNLSDRKVLRKKQLLPRNSWNRVEYVAVSLDGGRIAFCVLEDTRPPNDRLEASSRVLVFETGGKLLHTFDPYPATIDPVDLIASLSFSPDGRRLAGGGKKGVIVWGLDARKELHRFEGHRGKVNALSFSPDGRRLATASEDSTVLIWDVSN